MKVHQSTDLDEIRRFSLVSASEKITVPRYGHIEIWIGFPPYGLASPPTVFVFRVFRPPLRVFPPYVILPAPLGVLTFR